MTQDPPDFSPEPAPPSSAEPETSTPRIGAESGQDVFTRQLAPDDADVESGSTSLLSRLPATLGFVLILVGVYVLSTWPDFQSPREEYLYWGVFIPRAFDAGQWWRVITANLLHANPAHLLNNAFGIFIFGQMLEPAIGSRNLIGLFVFSGILAMLFSDWFLPGPTLGASGIDFGLIGTYITLILLIRRRTDPAMFRQELRSAIIFFVIFLGWNLWESSTVNLWGHLGGLVAGVIYAVFLLSRRKRAT